MGTKALMGSNFDRVSNRSFSRLHPKLEVKLSEYVDPWRSEITVVKGSVKAGSSGDIPKSSGHGGSATNNNNQLSRHKNSTAPMQLYTDSSEEDESSEPKKRGVATVSFKPSKEEGEVKSTKLGGAPAKRNSSLKRK